MNISRLGEGGREGRGGKKRKRNWKQGDRRLVFEVERRCDKKEERVSEKM